MAATADQIAAQHIGQDTPLPSLEIATEAQGGGGACDRDYGCSYSGTISFRTASTPLPMEYNPRKLFQRLFGRGDTPEERKALVQQYGSMLDMVREDAADLQKHARRSATRRAGRLPGQRARDRAARAEDRGAGSLEAEAAGGAGRHSGLVRPAPEPDVRHDGARLPGQPHAHRELHDGGGSQRPTYNNIGVPDAFHALSHHANDPAKKEKLVQIQTYHTEVFAKFLTKLAEIPDGDGTLLDHSIILYGSNMSNSNRHNQFPLPTALVGGGCGKMKGGQHLHYPDHTPLANVLLTMLDRAGVPAEKLGDSTQKLAEV